MIKKYNEIYVKKKIDLKYESYILSKFVHIYKLFTRTCLDSTILFFNTCYFYFFSFVNFLT